MAARLMGYVSASNTPTVVQQSAYGRATGGIGSPTAVTIGSTNYEYLTFNSTGTLTVTTAGWFDYLAVGGGGGCNEVSHTGGFAAGGGGAGQVVIGSVYLDANQTITIGGGGAPFAGLTVGYGSGNPTSIAATSPFTQTALGNQSGNNMSGPSTLYVGGGSGSINGGTTIAIFDESTAIGFRGGNSTSSSNGGGGGGQSARGGNGSSTTGGSGGAGLDVSVFIGGSELRKAMGGGGGGSGAGGTAATGGVAGSTGTTPPDGNANSGGGGGGGVGNCTTGNGGSGICYIRWKTS